MNEAIERLKALKENVKSQGVQTSLIELVDVVHDLVLSEIPKEVVKDDNNNEEGNN